MIVWRIKRATFQIASIRYRAIFPAYFLEKYFQIDSLFLSGKTYPRHIPKNITALVIVKDFQALDLPLMQKTHACNGKIIYDQCDNIFSKEKKTIDKFTQTMSNVSHLLDAVVTPTNSLAESFRKNGHDKLDISVIPDIAITKSEEYDAIKALSKHTKTVRGIFRFPQYGWADRLPNSESPIQHTKENKLKKLVWFGTARSKYGRTGLDLLKEIIPDLNTVQTYCPFELVIVSNKPRIFQAFFNNGHSCFPVKYCPWSIGNIYSALEFADAVLLPVSNDEFGRTKSNNRAILALSADVPVITNKHPSYRKLEDGLFMKNNYETWTETIISALSDQELIQKKLNMSKSIINRSYSGKIVAQKWKDLLY